MQLFIAEAMRALAEKLSTPFDHGPDVKASVLVQEHVLDISMAEAVSDGTFIFSNPESESESDWCVLALPAVERSSNSNVFRFRGRLRAGIKAADFVEKAYELILMRKVDEPGKVNYCSKLEEQRLTKRDFLKTLAQSTEARNLGANFVIVPEPSSWLSQLGVIPGDDSSFPPVLIRKRD